MRLKAAIAFLLFAAAPAWPAAIIVAPYDASPKVKARADYVCDGKDDQVELLASIQEAKPEVVTIDTAAGPKKVRCLSRHSVEWLAGNYNIGSTLTIPDCSDVVIQAEGTRFHYEPLHGDGVVVQGMNRCRYYMGTIWTKADGAALRVRPTKSMLARMSTVNYTGLESRFNRNWGIYVNPQDSGRVYVGTGLYLDTSENDICNNKFDGTYIWSLGRGILVGAPGSKAHRCEDNWLWLSYIMECKTDIWEQQSSANRNTYYMNVEANARNSTAVRAGGQNGSWYIIMGTGDWHQRSHENNTTKSIILDPGARNNVIEVHPYLSIFAPFVDNSGNITNVILSTDRPPFRNKPMSAQP